MKKLLVYILFAIVAVSCNDNSFDNSYIVEKESPAIFDGAVDGELLVKFAPEMEGILDSHFATRAVATRSGIPSTDEVLEILGAYRLERVFPVDPRTEERTREAGLHLWYKVYFDKDIDVSEAYAHLTKLGEVSKAQCNRRIYRMDSGRPVFVRSVDETVTENTGICVPVILLL